MMFIVPCGRKGQFLNWKMSYLKFKLTDTSVITEAEVAAYKQATIAQDYTVSSLIERMELYHGSNLLEQLHSYNLLHTLWTDIIGCGDVHMSTDHVLEGMGTNARVGEGLAAGESMYYAILFISEITSCMLNTYLPTGDMSADDLRVEIPLAKNNDGVTTSLTDTTAIAKTWTTRDVELVL